MFARRHPFLFFFLVISSVFAGFVLIFSAILVLGFRVADPGLIHTAGAGKGNIGVVEVKGVIASSKKVIRQIKGFRDNPAIKAIVIRVDSPGGGIGPSQEIYREIIKTREQKQVITSMGSVAASGGYYIAAACDKIMASKGSITGSIGVIMEYANISKVIEKIGISPVVIKSGELKDVGSPFRALEESEKKFLQDVVDELHQQFISDVAEGRGMPAASVAEIADGRILTGNKAHQLHLIDRIGNLEDAVQWAGELAGIDGTAVPVYPAEDKLGIFRKMAATLLKDLDITGPVSDNFRLIIN